MCYSEYSVLHNTTPLSDAVSHRFALTECQQALDTVARMESIKAVVLPVP